MLKRLEKRVAKAATRRAQRMERAERMGKYWKIRDDALWNPFEVFVFILLIVLAFGMFLGRGHFLYVLELFTPVVLVGVWVLLAQALIRYRAGQETFLQMFFRKFR
ncbi:hypothetical protein [Rhodalgimonas zhirmunskyi]|uniref:Uncharacterized protein n=1 Tax=Rhodalgimonas zhirmunskyi TaxID=2964767 RepID=A0AAJ1UA29_9RHOB|nr:hypothetical protein [Rhodoalgimonas zhirmunskyi]MDQ2094018.1 hypothetical protein [Rhodoalgimonas zhirmunskyi]